MRRGNIRTDVAGEAEPTDSRSIIDTADEIFSLKEEKIRGRVGQRCSRTFVVRPQGRQSTI